MLIDDDEPTNFLNRLAIEELDCVENIKVIQNAREALDYLHCANQPAPQNVHCPKPELIFLDINMPAMDGWEFLHYYEAMPAENKSSVIVIMLTTSFNPEDELKAQKIPSISEFKNKPLTAELLRGILQKYFPDVCP